MQKHQLCFTLSRVAVDSRRTVCLLWGSQWYHTYPTWIKNITQMACRRGFACSITHQSKIKTSKLWLRSEHETKSLHMLQTRRPLNTPWHKERFARLLPKRQPGPLRILRIAASPFSHSPSVPTSWQLPLRSTDESHKVALPAQVAKCRVVGVASKAIGAQVSQSWLSGAAHASSPCGGLSPAVFPIVPGQSLEACRPISGGALSLNDALPPASSSSQAWQELHSLEDSATTSPVDSWKSRAPLGCTLEVGHSSLCTPSALGSFPRNNHRGRR